MESEAGVREGGNDAFKDAKDDFLDAAKDDFRE